MLRSISLDFQSIRCSISILPKPLRVQGIFCRDPHRNLVLREEGSLPLTIESVQLRLGPAPLFQALSDLELR